MSCLECVHHCHGGCVHPTADRQFLDEDTTPCDLFAAPVTQPKPIKYEVPQAWYVKQALDAVKEG